MALHLCESNFLKIKLISCTKDINTKNSKIKERTLNYCKIKIFVMTNSKYVLDLGFQYYSG